MEIIPYGGKYSLYGEIFNNNNKTYLPVKTTNLGYEKTELPQTLLQDKKELHFNNSKL